MSVVEIVHGLTERGQTVATAESLTGGLVAAELTAVPGAGAVFNGGVVAYTPATKTALAGVASRLITESGVVSAAVAEALALGIRARTDSDWGIATTGSAGPTAHGGQPPGTVWIAVAEPSGQVTASRLTLSGERDQVRTDAVTAVLELLTERLGLGSRESVTPTE